MRNYVKLIGVVYLDSADTFLGVTTCQTVEDLDLLKSGLPAGWHVDSAFIWIELNKEILWEMANYAFNSGWPQWEGQFTQIPYNPHIKLESPRDTGYNSLDEKK